jgi:hypothetical protein
MSNTLLSLAVLVVRVADFLLLLIVAAAGVVLEDLEPQQDFL